MLKKPLRRAAVRRALVAAVVGVVCATLAVANPTWARSAGIDVWNVNQAERELAAALGATERLAADDMTVLNRIGAKESLVNEVIAGRLSLADAAEQFLDLSADAPNYLDILRDRFPDGTDEVRVARNVIEYVTQRVADPARRDALTSQLAAELADMTPAQ